MPRSLRFLAVLRFFGVLWVAAGLGAAGCARQEGVARYSVPKPKPVTTPTPTQLGGATTGGMPQVAGDRMFGAIVLRGDKAWFFKAVAARDAIAPHAEKLLDFVKSVRFETDGTPKWTLPEGWQEQPGSALRFATIVLGGTTPVELTVTVLPKTEADEAYILANVNRWRGQLGLGSIEAAQLATQSIQVPIADGQVATVVVLAAEAPAGGGASIPPSATPSAPGQAFALKYETPKGWTDQGARSGRKASFAVAEGDRSLDIAVTSFPAAAAQIANPISNINRWRRQIGLGEATPEQVAEEAKEVRVAGHRGVYIEMFAPSAEKAERATLAAMFRAGDDVWFVKLTGDGALAQREREAFRTFLDSIRLEGASSKPSPPDAAKPGGQQPDAEQPDAKQPDPAKPDAAKTPSQGATDGK